MRTTILSGISLFIALTALIIVLADRPGVGSSASAAQPDSELTRVEADADAGVIRFYIDGEPKAVLDGEGLHVRHGIRYGGTLIDYGTLSFDERFGEAGDAR